MANSYLYIHKMAKAHEDAKRELRRIIKAIENFREDEDYETIAECTPLDLQEVLEILEKPDKEEKK